MTGVQTCALPIYFLDREDVWAVPKNRNGGFRIYMAERVGVIFKNVLFEELALGGETVMAN